MLYNWNVVCHRLLWWWLYCCAAVLHTQKNQVSSMKFTDQCKTWLCNLFRHLNCFCGNSVVVMGAFQPQFNRRQNTFLNKRLNLSHMTGVIYSSISSWTNNYCSYIFCDIWCIKWALKISKYVYTHEKKIEFVFELQSNGTEHPTARDRNKKSPVSCAHNAKREYHFLTTTLHLHQHLRF